MLNEPEFRVPKTVKEDSKDYFNKVEEFLADEIDPVRFKGYRVPMGVYGQRDSEGEVEKYMVRVRIPGGVITKEQLKTLNDLTEKYGAGYLHFTTRQDIQIHRVDLEDTPQILKELLAVNLTPRGGGGNTVRNIMNSSRAGVNPKEEFDTTAHALALTKYLVSARSSFNLPRKYKIAFSSSSEDEALATINDLGFIAKRQKGQQGFKVYAAGGMGNQPEVAFLLEDFISEDKIFHVAEAIKRLFDEYGDRSNKHRARLRFVRKKLGEKGFKEKYNKYYQQVIAEGIEVEEIDNYRVINKKKPAQKLNSANNYDYLKPEKEQGYYSLELRPAKGDINSKEMKLLLELLADLEVSLRTTNRQGLLIRSLKGEKIKKLTTEIKAISSDLLQDYAGNLPVACKGASTCRLGLCLSPDLAIEINNSLIDLCDDLQKILPPIYISGCPNCCGQHLIGKIGLAGKAKRASGRLVPHYSLFLGGQTEEDNTEYGVEVIDIPAKTIPDFLTALADHLAEDDSYSRDNFNQYLEDNREDIILLAKEFTAIPAYDDNPDFYKDWGNDEDFSLAGRGPGECGVGVMDIIRLDIDTAKDNYQQGQKNKASDDLYSAVVNAARALLIVKGIDTKKDRLILNSFKDEFIATGLVKESYQELLDAAFDYKLGDIDSLVEFADKIAALIERVELLFNSLNSKLEFDISVTEEKLEDDEQKRDEQIELADLRGVKCPMNFIKAKVALANLDSGALLEIYLDAGEPIKNVPRSIEEEGHEVLAQEEQGEGYYLLRVKKR